MSNPLRGEVWLINFDPTKGDEIKKRRPAVIISESELSRLSFSIVVPITAWKDIYENFPWITRLDPSQKNGLTKASGADSFQIKSVSNARMIQKLGSISKSQLDNIVSAVSLCIGYE